METKIEKIDKNKINEEIIENSSLLYGPQTDFKKIWQDKLSALADKAWNDYHTQVTE